MKEVLRRRSAGPSECKIAREGAGDRKTVARCIKAATALGLERGCDLTDAVVHDVAQCVQARPLADALEPTLVAAFLDDVQARGISSTQRASVFGFAVTPGQVDKLCGSRRTPA